jgi:hypothetical protein
MSSRELPAASTMAITLPITWRAWLRSPAGFVSGARGSIGNWPAT